MILEGRQSAMIVTRLSVSLDGLRGYRWTWLTCSLAIACALIAAAKAAPTERLLDTFHNLDSDANGQVSAAEFQTKKIRVFTLRDSNGDYALERTEVGLDSDQFQAVDKDGDGKISGLEFVDSPMGHFQTYDLDGNGSLTLDELVDKVGSSTASP